MRELSVIPNKVDITDFGYLAKKMSFVLREIQDIFDDCNKDTAQIIARKYFTKKYNYYYKTETLNDLLAEGQEYVSI